MVSVKRLRLARDAPCQDGKEVHQMNSFTRLAALASVALAAQAASAQVWTNTWQPYNYYVSRPGQPLALLQGSINDLSHVADGRFVLSSRNAGYDGQQEILQLTSPTPPPGRLPGPPMWTQLPGWADAIVAAPSTGVPWALAQEPGWAADDMSIWKWNGANWDRKSGCARSLALSYNDDAWVIGCEGLIWEGDGVSWHQDRTQSGYSPTNAVTIRVDAWQGIVWVITADQRLFGRTYNAHWDEFDWFEYPTPPGGGLIDIAACRGVVWGLAGSVAIEGAVGSVWRMDGTTWRRVDNPGVNTQAANVSCNQESGQPYLMKGDGTLWRLAQQVN
jgi:hypothetical protein